MEKCYTYGEIRLAIFYIINHCKKHKCTKCKLYINNACIMNTGKALSDVDISVIADKILRDKLETIRWCCNLGQSCTDCEFASGIHENLCGFNDYVPKKWKIIDTSTRMFRNQCIPSYWNGINDDKIDPIYW